MEINMIDVQLMQAFHDHDIETIKVLQIKSFNLRRTLINEMVSNRINGYLYYS